MIRTRTIDAELRWRPSSLTRALVTCGGVALAAALIGSYWQLAAFAAPLIGVLCSVGWQRPVPTVRVSGQPDCTRCFESEQAEVGLWAETDSGDAAVEFDVTSVDGLRIGSPGLSSQRRTV